MAKQTKSRRSGGMSKAQPRSYSELYGNRETPISSAPKPVSATPSLRKVEEVVSQHGSDTVNWASEYGNVLGDVRQLLIISAALFALMIVLGYVI